jgi:hypothetical protein
LTIAPHLEDSTLPASAPANPTGTMLDPAELPGSRGRGGGERAARAGAAALPPHDQVVAFAHDASPSVALVPEAAPSPLR